MTPPRKFSALPPAGLCRASPKAISGRTSYLRVRLEFLPYPHLIAALFNGRAYGPPLPFTAASAWTWVDHPVSGLRVPTLMPAYAGSALFRLGFPPAPLLNSLTSPAPAARRTVLQKVRGRAHAALPLLVNTGFQVLFHSPPGVLFTFPSQYSALSVTKEYSALRGGPRSFPQGFSCPAVLWIRLGLLPLSAYGAFTLSGGPSQGPSASFPLPFYGAPYPGMPRMPVWAPSISLAATLEITVVFFSSGYLDVSVRRVPPAALWDFSLSSCGA